MDMLYQIIVGPLLGSIASSGVIYLLIRKYGENWIKSKFDRDLEEIRDEHKKEISKIEEYHKSMLNRATIIHEHEFVALPKAWRKITKAFYLTGPVINGQINLPLLSNNTDTEIKEILHSNNFSEKEVDAVINSSNKLALAANIQINKRHDDAQRSIFAASEYLIKHGIFIRPEISKELEHLLDDLLHAIGESRHADPNNIHESRPLRDKFKKEGIDRIKELENVVRKRLWNAEVYGNMPLREEDLVDIAHR